MDFANIDIQSLQFLLQLLMFQNQIINQAPANAKPAPLIGALEDFINQVGEAIQKQAE